MKKEFVAVIIALTLNQTQGADILARWNFNSNPPDNLTPTGTFAPAQGRGTVSMVGGVKASFTAGDATMGSSDNTALSTTSYPAQGTHNKSAGARFDVSTLGYFNIGVALRVTDNTVAPSTTRLQYTVDGTNFVDSLLMFHYPTNGFTTYTNVFLTERGLENNTNFAIRIVAEFGSQLQGDPPAPGYTTTSLQPYSPRGIIRIDEVAVWGQPYNQEPAPTLDVPANVTTSANVALSDIAVVVNDPNHPPEHISITVQSANETLLPAENITLVGGSSSRLLTLTPAANQIGSSVVTLTAANPRGRFLTRQLRFDVLPPNAPPILGPMENQVTLMDTMITVPLTLAVLDEQSLPVTLMAESSYPSLVPATHFRFNGEGTNRSISILPAANLSGNSRITVVATDRFHRRSTNSFLLTVRPDSEMLVCEPFEYQPGALTTNSSGFWKTHSGTAGQLSTLEGQAWLFSTQSEDVNVPLPGGPFAPAGGQLLYVGFTLNVRLLPSVAGQYFSHFNASGMRARIFIGTTNATGDSYRVGIANSSSTVAWIPRDLQSEQPYRLITRYNTATGESALWVDASSEADSPVMATDAATTSTISTYALRQNAGIGTLSVDDLKVGLSFTSVVRGFPPRLDTRTYGTYFEISWVADVAGYGLEWTDDLTSSQWTLLEGEAPWSANRRIILMPPETRTRFYRFRATNGLPARAAPAR